MIKIALIGCTGSIGRQVCDVVRAHPDRFRFSAFVCGNNGGELARLSAEFHPEISRLANGVSDPQEGEEELFAGCDVAFIAAGGFAGLSYTLAAVRAGKKIALANKESLVCGGELVMREVARLGLDLVPVDSEHSALFQCLNFHRGAPYKKLILTASGGPFLHFTEEELRHVTAKDALRHPTWNMGAKITVDSATLLNKGYEVIEAKWLYGADFSQIEAVVHPESIVHSLVCFEDGAAMAQLGYPDMKVPIQLALTYPERLACEKQLDLPALGALHFERLPAEKFPCYGLAIEAGKRGGTAPALLNGAAEVAVGAFLGGRITFPAIAETIEETLCRISSAPLEGFESLRDADMRARAVASGYIYGK